MIRIDNVTVPIAKDFQEPQLLVAAALGIPPQAITSVSIVKKSLDARRKSNIHFVYSFDVQVDAAFKVVKGKNIRMVDGSQPDSHPLQSGDQELTHRPVIVGAGPAGLFAALTLAEHGYRPLLIERGKKVEERIQDVGRFWTHGMLDPDSNVAFGEGGAGTFSDGKLMTRIRNPRISKVLDILIEAGAPDEIRYYYKPHIGTDRLQQILIRLRERLLENGTTLRYSTKLTAINVLQGRLKSITANCTDEIPCSVALLCIGHSARDTYQMLHRTGLSLEAKPFAVGLRLEHPQELINRIQYGAWADHPALPTAEYQIACQSSDGRGVYSFCMCPGGAVIGAATEVENLVVNGMSGSRRSGLNANAAIVCTVDDRDMETADPLSGIHFQRVWEKKAFCAGGGDYQAPAQNLGDFLANQNSKSIHTGWVKPSYRPGVIPANLGECLPEGVIRALREGIVILNKKMPGFSDASAVLTGVETRTSSPVRILRNENYMSRNVEGIYPGGEGAGYAGGIVSAAVDGIEIAEALIKRYKKPIICED